MPQEVWLRTNGRFWLALVLLPTATFGVAALAFVFVPFHSAVWVAAPIMAASVACALWLVSRSRKPRLSYADGMLEVHLTRPPLQVPIEIVECFFLGQGPSFLPNVQVGEKASTMETSNLIVRLAEAATDWKHRDVRPQLGQWCEGYITIRGTFCEPLSKEVAGRLNHRLVEVHREEKKNKQAVAT